MKNALILDFDEVIVETDYLWIEYVNKKYGIHSKICDYDKSLSLEKNVSILADRNICFDEFYRDFTPNYSMSYNLHKNVKLLPYASEVIKELSKEYYLFVSTARNSLGVDVVKYVLRKNWILQCFTGFHFAYCLNEQMEFIKNSKAEFISSFDGKAAFFVDDSENEIEKAKEIVPSILFDVTNTKKVEGAWNVSGWKEIGDFLL